MIPGPYSLCKVSFPTQGSDAATYTTLSYGYTSAKSALHEREKIALRAGVPVGEVAVIRFIDAEEGDRFVD